MSKKLKGRLDASLPLPLRERIEIVSDLSLADITVFKFKAGVSVSK
jgi:hypothetical protein